VAAAAALLVSARLRRQISLPLAEVVAGSEAIAAGDLSARVVPSTEDEIGVLAHGFNSMAIGLRDLVVQVRQGIGDVSEVSESLQESSGSMSLEAKRQKGAIAETAGSVEQVTASIREVNATIEQVADSARGTSSSILEMDQSISEVADHMDHLSESIDTTSTAVTQVTVNVDQVVQGVETLHQATVGALNLLGELGLSVRQVKDHAEESHALSEDTSQEASKGVIAVDETIAAMRAISSSFRQLESRVSRLAQKSQSIDEIVQVIQDVAERTNMLSLNASIIAAGAGEHGKPFSVVADEVKSLAHRTHRSTEEIAKLIRAVQDDTAAAVTAVEEGSARVEEGVQRSNVAGEVLSKIGGKSEVSTERVHEIVAATGRQTDRLERVEGAMGEVRDIVARIDRSAREQLRASTEIAEAVQAIRGLGAGVRSSTEEQRRGSGVITAEVTHIAERIDLIPGATQAQPESSQTIQDALEVFRHVTEETTRRAEAIRAMVTTLSEHAQQLEREIGRFKTH
jgi:methyl-accepting chemotaxis protein